MAAAAGGGGGAKATVAEQIGQAVQSTSNLLQLMEQSSPAQVSLPLSSSLLVCFLLFRIRLDVIQEQQFVKSGEFRQEVGADSCRLFIQVHLAKLPKNLLAKASLTKNTEQVKCHFALM
uniref:Tobamovirus multiplication protein 2B n=1 Tax=Triticum urartu TaxID=4572 RepID=A0A8R7P7D5_TRIUA